MNLLPCPCCSGAHYSECCSLLHNGKSADNPEQLMRSRYSAFALNQVEYLWRTSSTALQNTLTLDDLAETCESFDFVALEIKQAQADKVEFIASLLLNNELHPLHETSSFIQHQGQWRYDTGVIHPSPSVKLKRNDPCPCLSGKKFKQCHMSR
jgi:SEC-C motif-containing protein